MTLRTDGWYIVPGINLIMLRHNLRGLSEDIQRDGMPTSIVVERIDRILEYVPDDPPEAF